MNTSKKEQTSANIVVPVFDREKHKQEVKKMKLIKHRRKMKMSDRHDDVQRDSGDSDDFVAAVLPEEAPQDQWLNDLLGPPSMSDKEPSSRQSLKSSSSLDKGVAMRGQQKQIQETSSLSSLISKVLETIGNHPVEVAFLVLAFVVVRWFQGRSSKS